MKFLLGQDSITIGINLWLAPQISEHWPKNIPIRLMLALTWLRRPGVASALIPKLGIAQECNTSAAVIKIRMSILIGKITRLSTSRSRNEFVFISLGGIIYESNSVKEKSEYS